MIRYNIPLFIIIRLISYHQYPYILSLIIGYIMYKTYILRI